ncbi:carbohydrate kinase family protein [Undibacterium sp. RuRC25W]|uniref:carbohydrate kinase family protein n=1 Tax=Undibacterium sp. RuRC25W TaxID=3413047 RepID=UPI003BF26FA0
MQNKFPSIVCAGEALTDMIASGDDQWRSLVGGSTWNVARVLARAGVRTGFAGAISNDVFGDQLYAASDAAGLDLRLLQRNDHAPLLAIVAQSSPPSYFFIGDDSADLHFDVTQLPTGWSNDVVWAHFGGISLARQPLASTLVALAQQLKSQGVKISYDPNFRNIMNEHYDSILQTMTPLADVIKVSDEDLCGLFRIDNADKGLQRLRSMNPHATYLYTRGAEGASLYVGDEVWHTTTPRIKVVDTVGAGDASMAGLLYSLSLHPERDWQAHLHYAVASGAAACTAAGAQAVPVEQVVTLFSELQRATNQ